MRAGEIMEMLTELARFLENEEYANNLKQNFSNYLRNNCNFEFSYNSKLIN